MTEPDDAAYRGPEIPEPIGERLQVALALDDRPETFGDWVAAMERVAEREGIQVGPDALCTTDESPHRATFDGETRHYLCVQDAMIVPFLADGVDAVEVETESPVSGERIEFSVTDDGVTVDPPGAVLSFGVATDVEPPNGDVVGHAYGQVCPYGNAFVDREEYETWTDSVDAHTVATSVEESLELARALGGIEA